MGGALVTPLVFGAASFPSLFAPFFAALSQSHVSGHFSMDSPQSMLLSADQNTIMRMPNFGSFMHQQVRRRSCTGAGRRIAFLYRKTDALMCRCLDALT